MTAFWVMGAGADRVTIIGGSSAVAHTDSIQTGIIVIGCSIMVFTGLHRAGGWHELALKVPLAGHIAKPYTDPNYPFWGVACASAVMGWAVLWAVLAAPDVRRHRFRSCRAPI